MRVAREPPGTACARCASNPTIREPGFTRRFRGSTYLVEVKNADGRQRGVRRLRVDGNESDANILPVCPPRPEPIRVLTLVSSQLAPTVAMTIVPPHMNM